MGECYIAKEHLRELAAKDGKLSSELLEQEILPDAPPIRSGDFGEMLCRSTLQGLRDRPCVPVYRWRNRAHKNDTVRGCDLVGYVLGTNPSASDVLILCEVKTRSSAPDPEVAVEALRGVLKDYATRLANTVFFSQHALLRDGFPKEASELARFYNLHKHGEYKRRLVACVVYDAGLWQDTVLDVLPKTVNLGQRAEGQVLVIRVEDLSTWMSEVFQAVPAVY